MYTQDFTTPQFADTLKEYGIEIDTPFRWRPIEENPIVDGYYLDAIDNYDRDDYANVGWIDAETRDDIIRPAYPITRVLRWLPDTATIKNIPCNLEVMDAQSGRFRYNGRTHIESVQRGWLHMEQLITQGFTEGWLTKEIIEQQINQNQCIK